MTDNNIMWADIECGASTVTACLPTLGPLFPRAQSPESLIRSAKSALSIKSGSLCSIGSKRKISTDESSHNLGETKRAWYELHSRDTNGTIAGNAGSDELEAQTQMPMGVMIGKAFESDNVPGGS